MKWVERGKVEWRSVWKMGVGFGVEFSVGIVYME